MWDFKGLSLMENLKGRQTARKQGATINSHLSKQWKRKHLYEINGSYFQQWKEITSITDVTDLAHLKGNNTADKMITADFKWLSWYNVNGSLKQYGCSCNT